MLKKIALILGAALLFAGCKNLPKVGSPSPEGTQGQDYTVKGLKAAVDLGLTLKCTYNVNDATYEGYVKGKQWRGKLIHPQMGVGEVIIQEDGCMYSWQEGDNQGIKMCFDPAEMWEQEDTMTDIEYKCQITTVDDSMFAPPGDINFVDPMSAY